jgi:hypothetical protein
MNESTSSVSLSTAEPGARAARVSGSVPDPFKVVYGNPEHVRLIRDCRCAHVFGNHVEGRQCRYCTCDQFRVR